MRARVQMRFESFLKPTFLFNKVARQNFSPKLSSEFQFQCCILHTLVTVVVVVVVVVAFVVAVVVVAVVAVVVEEEIR